MGYEQGGRADKAGNRYEYNWTILQILDVLDEKIKYVRIEAVGEDEAGVDLWIGKNDGTQEGQQCKGRQRDEDHWTYGELHRRGILKSWKKHFVTNPANEVSLVSPLSYTVLEDLTSRARNTDIEKPEDFYNYQIKANKKIEQLYSKLCHLFGIDYNSTEGIRRSINYLSRCHYRQYPDGELRDIVLRTIEYMFISEPEIIYGALLNLIINEDIWGKSLDAASLFKYLEENEIQLWRYGKDEKNAVRIQELNDEYKRKFIPLSYGMLQRQEASSCWEAILEGKSVILHGKAGVGKSGCIENLIQYCEESGVPYLAIKLDVRVPENTSNAWGETMGLSYSPAFCLREMMGSENAVLIFDQLDILRWTSAHSRTAIDVCLQIIREIEAINMAGDNKISLVMACRTYDLETDKGIGSLFEESHKYSLRWQRIHIDKFDEAEVKNVIGAEYGLLQTRTRELLSLPSNLYIWEQLSDHEACHEIKTTYQLVQKWWEQIEIAADLNALPVDSIKEFKAKTVGFCENSGRTTFPKEVLAIVETCYSFLESSGIIVSRDSIIQYVHQSILDCFMSESMVRKYFETGRIEDIVGNIGSQVLEKRFQFLMFLQRLLEISEEEFIKAGKQIIESESIRFYYKSVFLEILSQIEQIDENIEEFIDHYISDDEWKKHLIDIVIIGKPIFVHLLREKGYLTKWIKAGDIGLTIRLLGSIDRYYTSDDIKFIEQYAIIDGEDSNWKLCFLHDIAEDSEELFELRLKYYDKHPETVDWYLEPNKLLDICELRLIRIIAVFIRRRLNETGDHSFKDHRFSFETERFEITEYKAALELLLPLIPDDVSKYSDWSDNQFMSDNVERAGVLILKKAAAAYVREDPKGYVEYIKPYLNSGNSVYNEIILTSFTYLDETYSDFVIRYLVSDIDKNMFEFTSGESNELFLAKQLVEKHSLTCSNNILAECECRVVNYISPNAAEWLRRRIEHNNDKATNGRVVYWRFWGDFQKEILELLPEDRISRKSSDLLNVLRRSVNSEHSIYKSISGHSGGVFSPVDKKNLSVKNWIGIITNTKIPFENHTWERVDEGFVESTVPAFAAAFRNFLGDNNTEEVLQSLIECRKPIVPEYVGAVFDAIGMSDDINDVPVNMIESMIRRYMDNDQFYRSICRIIDQRTDSSWSADIIDYLNEIALKCIADESTISEGETAESIVSGSYSSVCESAAEAIGRLLDKRPELFTVFKDTIRQMASSDNVINKRASLAALFPSLEIDEKWAADIIKDVVCSDCRLLHGQYIRFFLCDYYTDYRTEVDDVVRRALVSEDKLVLKTTGHCIAEMYILYDAFKDVIDAYDTLCVDLQESILEMMIRYFKIQKYKEKAKLFLERAIDIIRDNQFVNCWKRLFHEEDDDIGLDDINDAELIRKVVEINGNAILAPFVNYLKKQENITPYSDLIISTGYRSIDELVRDNSMYWQVHRSLTSIVLDLYDKHSSGSTPTDKRIIDNILDLWDYMFKNNYGIAQELTQKMMDM